MKKLHKYILLTYIKPLFVAISIVLFIFTLWFLYRYIDELVGKGISPIIICELLLYNASSSMPLALPIAILFASLISFGNLTEFSELTAIKASGISVLKALKPAIILMFFISAIAFYFANTIAPKSLLKMGVLIYDLRNKKDSFELRQGVFYNDINDFSILFNSKDPKSGALQDIIIYKKQYNNNLDLIRSKKGIIKISPDNTKLVLQLHNGSRYIETTKLDSANHNALDFTIFNFYEHTQVIKLDGFSLSRTPETYFSNAYQILNSKQLINNIDSAKDTLKNHIEEVSLDLGPQSYLKKLKQNHTSEVVYIKTTNKKIAFMEAIEILLQENAHTINEIASSYVKPLPTDYKSSYSINFPILFTENIHEIYQNSYFQIERNIHDIEILINNIDNTNTTIRNYQVELYKKLTLATTCIILFFIGAPLAFIINRGGLGIPLIVSVLFFLLFYALNIAGEKLSKSGVLDPIIGMWLPVFILLIIATILTYISLKEIKPGYIIKKILHFFKNIYRK